MRVGSRLVADVAHGGSKGCRSLHDPCRTDAPESQCPDGSVFRPAARHSRAVQFRPWRGAPGIPDACGTPGTAHARHLRCARRALVTTLSRAVGGGMGPARTGRQRRENANYRTAIRFGGERGSLRNCLPGTGRMAQTSGRRPRNFHAARKPGGHGASAGFRQCDGIPTHRHDPGVLGRNPQRNSPLQAGLPGRTHARHGRRTASQTAGLDRCRAADRRTVRQGTWRHCATP